MDILSAIQTISDNRKALGNHKGKLLNDLSALDKKISNIYHVIEISNMNAVQFTKVSYKLKEVLVQRRQIKEDVIMIDGCLKDNKSSETLTKEATKRLERYSQECKQALSKLI